MHDDELRAGRLGSLEELAGCRDTRRDMAHVRGTLDLQAHRAVVRIRV
jgi:hypothetical protein